MGSPVLRVCGTHAVDWERDGIILQPDQVLDVEPGPIIKLGG